MMPLLVALLKQNPHIAFFRRVGIISSKVDLRTETLHFRESIFNERFRRSASIFQFRRVKTSGIIVALTYGISRACCSRDILARINECTIELSMIDKPQTAIALKTINDLIRCIMAGQGESHIEIAVSVRDKFFLIEVVFFQCSLDTR